MPLLAFIIHSSLTLSIYSISRNRVISQSIIYQMIRNCFKNLLQQNHSKALYLFSNQNDGFKKFQRKKSKKPEDQAINTSDQNTTIKDSQNPIQPDAEQKQSQNQPKNVQNQNEDKRNSNQANDAQQQSQKPQQAKLKDKKQTINPEENKQNKDNAKQTQNNQNQMENENDQKQKEKEKQDRKSYQEYLKDAKQQLNDLEKKLSEFRNEFEKATEKYKINWKKVLMYSVISGVVSYSFYQQMQPKQIDFLSFVNSYLMTDQVKHIDIYQSSHSADQRAAVNFTTVNEEVFSINIANVDFFLQQVEQIQISKGIPDQSFIPIQFKVQTDKLKIFDKTINFVHVGISAIIAYALIRSLKGIGSQGGNDIMKIVKSGAKEFEQSVKVKFKDVAGLDEAKVEVQEFVDFLKNPKKYIDIGAKIPRGALLNGPPGTGKTMLAKACAGEAEVPFFYISGSDFTEMFVGVGAARVRDLFKNAKQKSPSIIFIDEIDAVGRKRENKVGGNDERDNTLNQLLVEMDGFGTNSNVVVLAATNRKELLDNALTRPGRFDRSIEIGLPDLEGRKQVFNVHLQNLKLNSEKTLEDYAKRLATLTPGFSGADIANICNEAAILAARSNKQTVDAFDFENATERVIGGLEKKKIISPQERKTVAYHESGHAIVSWFLEGGYPLLKLTIIPRSKGSLGFAQYLPRESSLETKEELMDRICFILGGRCAEEHFFKKVTTGAYDDLKKAYELAYNIVTKFGMSEEIGLQGLPDEGYVKLYSEHTNKLIDQAIQNLILESTQRTRALIKQYSTQLENLAEKLLEKETLTIYEIEKIIGKRPFQYNENVKEYLLEKQKEQIVG